MLQKIARGLRILNAKCRRLGGDESGSVLTFLVVIPVLAGTAAIGIETGQLYRVKRQMQSAADAAALAGSVDRIAGKTSAVIATTAQYEAQRNGFTNGSNGVVVTVNTPPASGANVSATGAVEVVVTKSQTFSLGAVINNLMGVTNNGFTMRARSVAAQGTYNSTTTATTTTTSNEGCMVALTTAAEQGISFTSFNNFNSDCTIISNGASTSNNSSASVYMSSFNNATLKSVWTKGSFYSSSYNHLTLTRAAQTNQTSSVVDPYAGLATPTPGACTYNPFSAPGGSSITINPGTYCGGLTVRNYSNVYFTPGTYYIANGDLYLTSDNNISCPTCTGGAGITFVITQTTGNNADIGGVKITSENNVTFNAPSAGTYAGVLFYQDRRVAVGTMTSTSKIFTLSSLNNATLYGAIYFPNNRIDISSINNFGGTSTTGCTVWIGRYLKFSSYNNTYTAGCSTYNTIPAGITTTTTTTTSSSRIGGKVVE